MDGSQYSLKTLNKLSESPVLKSIKTNFKSYYDNFEGDEEYKKVGVEIKKSSKEVFNNCNLLAKVNCPSDDEISNLKDKTILIGILNPSTFVLSRNERYDFKDDYQQFFPIHPDPFP